MSGVRAWCDLLSGGKRSLASSVGWRSGGGPVRPLAESQAIALVFGTHDRHQSVLSVWGHNGRLWFQSLPFIGGARLHNPVP